MRVCYNALLFSLHFWFSFLWVWGGALIMTSTCLRLYHHVVVPYLFYLTYKILPLVWVVFVWNQDYFDVIDTPMDFGTVCGNLENGVKYMNSEDVYKDVHYIWDNCNKYNNKGDYILDLMRRVKKNFMKYWTAAGLYGEQPRGTKGETSAVMLSTSLFLLFPSSC